MIFIQEEGIKANKRKKFASICYFSMDASISFRYEAVAMLFFFLSTFIIFLYDGKFFSRKLREHIFVQLDLGFFSRAVGQKGGKKAQLTAV